MQPRSAISKARIEGSGYLARRWTPSNAETLGHAIDARTLHLRPRMAWIALERLALEQRRECSGLGERLPLHMPEIADMIVHTEP